MRVIAANDADHVSVNRIKVTLMDHASRLSVSNAASTEVSTSWLGLSRPELVALLLVVGIANALMPNIVNGIAADGIVFATLNTFEISAVVWLAVFVTVKYALLGEKRPITLLDRGLAIAFIFSCLLPIGPVMWLLLTAFALKLITGSKRDDFLHRAGWVCFALTVPMFWSKRLFNMFSEFFLAIDAELVSSITQTERISNLVPIPGGTGYLQIAAPCSSMANVSLALLCWILFTQTGGVRWKPRNVLWCGLACLSVVAVNVTRISLIGFYPNQYELLHGPIGSTVVSWTTVLVVLAVCFYGVGRGRFKLI